MRGPRPVRGAARATMEPASALPIRIFHHRIVSHLSTSILLMTLPMSSVLLLSASGCRPVIGETGVKFTVANGSFIFQADRRAVSFESGCIPMRDIDGFTFGPLGT